MKKIGIALGVVLLLLAVAAAAGPFWFGMQMENVYTEMVQQMSANSTAAFTTKRYERGWLSSSAETTIQMPRVPFGFRLTSEIEHGPIAINRILQGELQLKPALAFVNTRISMVAKKGAGSDLAKAFIKQGSVIKADTVVSFNGDADTEVNVPASLNKGKSGSNSFNWRGLTGSIRLRDGGRSINIDLRSPSVTMSLEESGKVAIKTISFRSDTRAGTGGMMFGNSTLQIGKFELGDDVEISGLRLSSTSKPAGKNLNTTVKYRVKGIKVGERTYGPGRMTLVVRKLDIKTLRQYEKKVSQISKRTLPQEQASMMVAAETMKLFAKLSKNAPEIEISNLSFNSGEGELTGTAKLVLDGSNADVGQNLMLLVTALQGSAKFSIPPSMVKAILAPQIRQDIEAYKKKGLLTSREAAQLTPSVMAKIVDEAYPSYLSINSFTKHLIPAGSHYKISASFLRGRVLVNNKPLKQPLFGLAM